MKVRGADALAAKLAASRGDARLYRRLATLVTDVPLGETLADLEWRGADRERWSALCERLKIGDTLRARVKRFR